MAEVYQMQFRGTDRAPFAAWLEKCQRTGAATTMVEAIRLAVWLGTQLPDDTLPALSAQRRESKWD